MYHHTSYHRLEIFAAKTFLLNNYSYAATKKIIRMHKSRTSTVILEAAMMKIKHHQI